MLERESAPKRLIKVLTRRRNPVDGSLVIILMMLLSAGFRSVSYRKDTLGTDRVVIGSY